MHKAQSKKLAVEFVVVRFDLLGLSEFLGAKGTAWAVHSSNQATGHIRIKIATLDGLIYADRGDFVVRITDDGTSADHRLMVMKDYEFYQVFKYDGVIADE